MYIMLHTLSFIHLLKCNINSMSVQFIAWFITEETYDVIGSIQFLKLIHSIMTQGPTLR